MSKSDKNWFVYLLECTNGRLYTGITTDVAARLEKHISGKGAMFTRLNRPKRIIAATPCADRSTASKMEAAIKKLTAPQKRALAKTWQNEQDAPTRKS